MMLVETVGAPEDAVTVGAWILFKPFMKLFFVTFPVELALKPSIARGTSVNFF